MNARGEAVQLQLQPCDCTGREALVPGLGIGLGFSGMIVIVLLLGLWIACDCTEGEACIKIVNWIQILVRDCELVCQPGLWLSFYQNCRQQNLCNEVSQWSTSILCILAMCWNYMATLLMGSLSFVSLYLCIFVSVYLYILTCLFTLHTCCVLVVSIWPISRWEDWPAFPCFFLFPPPSVSFSAFCVSFMTIDNLSGWMHKFVQRRTQKSDASEKKSV